MAWLKLKDWGVAIAKRSADERFIFSGFFPGLGRLSDHSLYEDGVIAVG
jgi:hypothetical protein